MSDSKSQAPLAFNSAKFLQSASSLGNCPPETLIEIAFAGRSNAGKSSAINTITNNKKLARTSKTPGRTQLINFFSLNDPRIRLVDLPGYGYAKVSLEMKAEWGKHLDDYMRDRLSLGALVLIMDIRKPLTEFDQMILSWAADSDMPIVILLTKADKLKRGAQKNTYFKVKKELEEHPTLVDIVIFSSHDKTGLKESQGIINGLFDAAVANAEAIGEHADDEESEEEPLAGDELEQSNPAQ